MLLADYTRICHCMNPLLVIRNAHTKLYARSSCSNLVSSIGIYLWPVEMDRPRHKLSYARSAAIYQWNAEYGSEPGFNMAAKETEYAMKNCCKNC